MNSTRWTDRTACSIAPARFLVLIVLLACHASSAQPRPPATQPTTATAILPIDYHHSIYLVGFDRHITISPDGMILLDQRGAGPVVKKSGRLTAEQIAGLSKLFDGWERLKPAYPGVTDGPHFEIRYGGQTVYSGGGTIEPKTLLAIRERLEALAASLDTKQE